MACFIRKSNFHDDVIKWKHFSRYWRFVRGIHRSPVNSPHNGQWRGALMFPLICVAISGWVNNHKAGDLRLYRAHYGVIIMSGGIAKPGLISLVKLDHWPQVHTSILGANTDTQPHLTHPNSPPCHHNGPLKLCTSHPRLCYRLHLPCTGTRY